MQDNSMDYSLRLLEDTFYIIEKQVNVAVYDYEFSLYHNCTHPVYLKEGVRGIFRIGAVQSYEALYEEFKEMGVNIVNSPAEHKMASELTSWYPILSEFTPKSICFNDFPPYAELIQQLGPKIFLKGARQTSRHDPSLSLVNNGQDYLRIQKAYLENDILHWQTVVARQFVELKPVRGEIPGKLPPKFEFRTFWFENRLIGFGQYWYQVPPYAITDKQRESCIELGQTIANEIKVPFVAIDLGLTVNDEWILIECNDAQESGYAGISPRTLWNALLQSAY